MYAIAHLDELGKARFVREDSGESLWSTSDIGRARTFDSSDDAEGWVISLPVRLSDRIYSRRAYAFDVDSGERSYLVHPEPDDATLTTPYEITPEPEKAIPAPKSRPPRACEADRPLIGDQR